jgi:hypothetical protein
MMNQNDQIRMKISDSDLNVPSFSSLARSVGKWPCAMQSVRSDSWAFLRVHMYTSLRSATVLVFSLVLLLVVLVLLVVLLLLWWLFVVVLMVIVAVLVSVTVPVTVVVVLLIGLFLPSLLSLLLPLLLLLLLPLLLSLLLIVSLLVNPLFTSLAVTFRERAACEKEMLGVTPMPPLMHTTMAYFEKSTAGCCGVWRGGECGKE